MQVDPIVPYDTMVFSCDATQLIAYFDELRDVDNSVGGTEYHQRVAATWNCRAFYLPFSELFRWTCYKKN